MTRANNIDLSRATTSLLRGAVALLMLWVINIPAHAKPVVTASDTLTAGEVFTNLPISVLDILPRTSRLDMLDYAAVDSLRPTLNNMGEISTLQLVSPTALDVKLTNVSDLKIRILPYAGSEVAMTIYTVGRKESSPDSQINFFNSSMQKLPTNKFISLPEIEDFLIDKVKWHEVGKKISRKEVLDRIPFMTVTYTMEPDSDLLKAHLTIGKYLPVEDVEFVTPFLCKELTYKWNGKRFVKL
ncbi:MAG: DUF3256 family protein [Bacteroidales bacterium]|nr:DUF3256 family protein [Bacteroidales bacterium]